MELMNVLCMHSKNPVGVDTKKPCFRWAVDRKQSTGCFQSAYQIVIGNRYHKALLDTGRVESNRQTVYLQLPFLESSQKYEYRIRIWNELGEASPFCDPQSFVTGILDWESRPNPLPFILPKDVEHFDMMNDTILYQSEITVTNPFDFAAVHIASIGQHELYVNGRKVGNRLMAPSRSKIQQDAADAPGEKQLSRVHYVSYDLSSILKQGNNTVAVWVDAGWARAYGLLPKIAAECVVRTEDCKRVSRTDPAHWLCTKMGVSHINGYHWGDFGGERILASACKEPLQLLGNEWFQTQSAGCDSLLSADMTCGDEILREITPVAVSAIDQGFLVDMGENDSGFIRFEVTGEALGTVVTVSTADKLSEQATFCQISEFVIDENPAVFCNRFNYASGRYYSFKGLKNPPARVAGLVVGNRFAGTAAFQCSDPLINTIYQNDLDTFTAATINGVTMDCPHRERLGYGETGISTAWGIGLHAFDTRAYYRQVFRNWRDRQTKTGYLPHVAPNWEGGGGTAWSSCLTISVYDYLCLYPDDEILEENYDALVQWAEYLLSNTDQGLLRRNPEDQFGFGYLGDWASFEGDDWGFSQQAAFFNNCISLYVLQITKAFASQKKDAYTERKLDFACRCMRKAIHEVFYNKQTQAYLNGEQRYYAVALCAGVPCDEDYPAVLKHFEESLAQKPYLDGGSAGMTFIFRAAICHLKNPLLVYRHLLCTEMPSYGYFIRQGNNTWPELWNMSDTYGGSRIHTCYTGVSGLLVQGLAGMMPSEQGAQTPVISPQFPKELTSLSYKTDYGFGTISVEWTRTKENLIDLHITVPYNVQATLILPNHCQIGGENSKKMQLTCGTHQFQVIRGVESE